MRAGDWNGMFFVSVKMGREAVGKCVMTHSPSPNLTAVPSPCDPNPLTPDSDKRGGGGGGGMREKG